MNGVTAEKALPPARGCSVSEHSDLMGERSEWRAERADFCEHEKTRRG